VDEDDGRPRAAREVADTASGDRQLPPLEPVQIRFAVRHVEGIFFP
jgi:hypothetical protein